MTDDRLWGPGRANYQSVLAVLSLLAHYWVVLVSLPIAGAALSVGGSLLWPKYEARSSFVPEDRGVSGDAGLAGLAAQFGVSVGLGGEDESPDFYAALVRSHDLLSGIAMAAFPEEGGAEPFVVVLGLAKDPPATPSARTIEKLQRLVNGRVDVKAGMVIVETTARRVEVAEALNRKILEAVSRFNLEKRQSRAAAERIFIEERVDSARRELEEAEETLRQFYDGNRSFEESPRLQFEARRMEREIAQRQGVFNSLTQAYEEARIGEVRNTPVITVIDNPEGSGDRSGRLRGAVLGFVMGGGLALGCVGAWSYLGLGREGLREEPAPGRDVI